MQFFQFTRHYVPRTTAEKAMLIRILADKRHPPIVDCVTDIAEFLGVSDDDIGARELFNAYRKHFQREAVQLFDARIASN